MRKGKFIVIEGTDGSGKATQAKLLAQALRRKGKKVQTIAFPQYGQKSAGAVEAYLNGVYGTPREVGPYRMAIFYAVDRAAAKGKLREWLQQGLTVVADRYFASNMAYTAAIISLPRERQQYWQWAKDLEFGLFGIPRPDVTVVLTVPPRISQRLILKKQRRLYIRRRKRDIHERNIKFQRRVITMYRLIAKRDRSTHVIDCAPRGKLLSKQEIHRAILSKLGRMV